MRAVRRLVKPAAFRRPGVPRPRIGDMDDSVTIGGDRGRYGGDVVSRHTPVFTVVFACDVCRRGGARGLLKLGLSLLTRNLGLLDPAQKAAEVNHGEP